MNILLQGVVGSTAYGLAREGSDVDRLGVWTAPSEDFWGLRPPVGKLATVVQHEPSDLTLHELGKYCALALQCNPTILELLWLPDDLLEVKTTHGMLLRGRRTAFLSKKRVADAYFGYAEQQFTRLTNKHRFPDVPINRIEKHARHLRRLLVQGWELYTTGAMNVKVDDPETYFEFGQRVGAGDLQVAEDLMSAYRYRFDTMTSILPEYPNSAEIELFLRRTRRGYLG